MLLQQVGQRANRRFLQHLLEHGWRFAVAHEYTVVLGNRSVQPQSITNHIGLGDGSDTLCCPDIDIAADYHGGQSLGGLLHHALIERQLQVEQGLRQALATLPSENGQRGQNLAAGRIGWQAPALPACMQDDAALTIQPVCCLLQ